MIATTSVSDGQLGNGGIIKSPTQDETDEFPNIREGRVFAVDLPSEAQTRDFFQSQIGKG